MYLFCLKIHQNRLAAAAPAGPTVGAHSAPLDVLARFTCRPKEAALRQGRDGRKGTGSGKALGGKRKEGGE